MSSSNLSSALRREIAEAGWFRCSYCQSQEDIAGMRFTIDHIIPKPLGGTDELSFRGPPRNPSEIAALAGFLTPKTSFGMTSVRTNL